MGIESRSLLKAGRLVPRVRVAPHQPRSGWPPSSGSRYDTRVTAFELLGDTADETRLLVDDSGYSVPLPGHPSLAAVPTGTPKYDAIVVSRDVQVEYGFRRDELPSGTEPRALAQALATAYATNRAASPPRPRPIADKLRPGTAAGAQATYPLRDSADDPRIEQLWLLVHTAPAGFQVLYHTTRFRTADLNIVQWAHLRSLIIDQHRWDPAQPRRTAPALYPASAFAVPCAKLDLTDAAWAEAAAKAEAIGPLTSDQVRGLADLLFEFAQTDDPPPQPLIPPQLQIYSQRIAMATPPRAAEAILRNLETCKTAFDLRAWAWQCAWAIGNRKDQLRGN